VRPHPAVTHGVPENNTPRSRDPFTFFIPAEVAPAKNPSGEVAVPPLIKSLTYALPKPAETVLWMAVMGTPNAPASPNPHQSGIRALLAPPALGVVSWWRGEMSGLDRDGR
jgi:hypothetical protein